MKQTDEALAKLIEKGIEVAEKSGKFVIDQAPELLQQFYTWHIVQNVFGILLGVLFLYASYKVVKIFGQEDSTWDNDIQFLNKWIGMGTAIISVILIVVGLLFFIRSCYELLFIITAPKLYLIEYFIK